VREGAGSKVEKEFQLVNYVDSGGMGIVEYGGGCSSVLADVCCSGEEIKYLVAEMIGVFVAVHVLFVGFSIE
jgi:hypothetical protein